MCKWVGPRSETCGVGRATTGRRRRSRRSREAADGSDKRKLLLEAYSAKEIRYAVSWNGRRARASVYRPWSLSDRSLICIRTRFGIGPKPNGIPISDRSLILPTRARCLVATPLSQNGRKLARPQTPAPHIDPDAFAECKILFLKRFYTGTDL